MIKFENTEVVGWEHAIRGMRNPLESWEKSDSDCTHCMRFTPPSERDCESCSCLYIGRNDYDLMKRLINAGTDHRKFMRMIVVYVDITAPLYWWKEFDTYKVGTVENSCSTMHKIADKAFTLDDFSYEHLFDDGPTLADHYLTSLTDTIDCLNCARERYLQTKDKKYWWQMIQLLPSSYNQKRTVMMNYEVLANIYKSRKDHKLDEWSGKDCFTDLVRNCNTCVKNGTYECHHGKDGGFIQWIDTLPYSELITGKYNDGDI